MRQQMESRGAFIFSAFILMLMISEKNILASECGNLVPLNVTYSGLYLTSPNYPNPYPRPSSCSWVLQAVEGNVLVIRFFDFQLTASPQCYRDSFKVLDGPTKFSNEILFMCGDFSKPTKYRTSEDAAVVYFQAVTKGSPQPGFSVRFWSEDKEPITYGPAKFIFVHYCLMVASGIVAFFMILGIGYLCFQHHKRKRDDDDDDDYSDDDSIALLSP